jgi:phospholipid/cholesterol/gamma-HCH transport system ATP-binding protein
MRESSERSIVEITEARPSAGLQDGPPPTITLRLAPAELATIETPDAASAAWLADLCTGLIPLTSGRVRFLEYDWAAMPRSYAAALRGRIGRVFSTGGWIPFLDVASNVLLAQLHHGRERAEDLHNRAVDLACQFGLPGLPLERPGDLSARDLARAACVRAFLGSPALLLLESPAKDAADLTDALLGALAEARDGGTAAIWFTCHDLPGDSPPPLLPFSYRLRLDESGLVAAARGAR